MEQHFTDLNGLLHFVTPLILRESISKRAGAKTWVMMIAHASLLLTFCLILCGPAACGVIDPVSNDTSQILDARADSTPISSQLCTYSRGDTSIEGIGALNSSSTVSTSRIRRTNPPNQLLTSKRRLIWCANFHEKMEMVKSPSFNLKFTGSEEEKYLLRVDSTQPVVITEYSKHPGDTGWGARRLSKPGGEQLSTYEYTGPEDYRLMFDVEVPDLPEGDMVTGRVEWVEISKGNDDYGPNWND